jgi:hypothetical protein
MTRPYASRRGDAVRKRACDVWADADRAGETYRKADCAAAYFGFSGDNAGPCTRSGRVNTM